MSVCTWQSLSSIVYIFTFASNTRSLTKKETSERCSNWDCLWACPQILRPDWKGFPRTNPLAYYASSSVTKEKSFITLTKLGSQSRYMNKLLSIVRKKVADRTIDVTLKFSLSALWNLTDESPQTCNVFLQEGGMQLFLQVIRFVCR